MRLGRVVAVTTSIAFIGAIIGGVVGAILLAGWSLPAGLRGTALASYTARGALFGALLGGVLAPITAWAFLRRVPLGRALLVTTVGTTIGAAIGLVFDRVGLISIASLPSGLVGALVGFLASVIKLRFGSRTPRGGAGMEKPEAGAPS